MIPETENTETLGFKKIGSFLIVFDIVQMLTAIQLNNQTSVFTKEVNNVSPQGLLSAKFEPRETPGT